MVAASSVHPLPPLIEDAIRTLSWSLDPSAYPPMRLETLERMAEIRSPPILGNNVLAIVALLLNNSSTAAVATPAATTTATTTTNDEHWARIATALILLGLNGNNGGGGYCADEAHNLIGPLSYPTPLPYFSGPPVNTSADVLAAASIVHCLVHRREGPHIGEFGMTGFSNSDFWAGSALRSGGEETLPLREIQQEVLDLITMQGDNSSSSSSSFPAQDAQEWLQEALSQAAYSLEWDPRPLTGLCAEVLQASSTSSSSSGNSSNNRHVLKEFAEQAASIELKVLLKHALTKLGYDTSALLRTKRRAARSTTATTADSSSAADPTNILSKLPQTFDQALKLHDKAVVVTTASSPHRIVHVNQAWVDLCGYTREQAVNKTFSIIQGPESNIADAAAMVRRCLDTLQPQETYLINYMASGERFINHVAIRPLKRDHQSTSSEVDLLVGILQQVHRMPAAE